MPSLRIALGQINAIVGDLTGNVRKMSAFAREAGAQGARLIVFPELALAGYPPEDLLFKPSFVQANAKALRRLAQDSRGIALVAGFVDADPKGNLFNAAAFCRNGAVETIYRKMMLPNYGVFDEKRYFLPGRQTRMIRLNGMRLALTICEDIWQDEGPLTRYAELAPDVILNLSASPYHAGKLSVRERMLFKRARQVGAAMVYVNLVGGQDELVFDGASMVVDEQGKIRARGRQFDEQLLVVDMPVPRGARGRR
ncbi:MAG: NAD+ synthase, partial [Candidatus Omnitrophica bacterium]|nr:NAD+ synthase [Candidatus Omnitrophota bacterium]